MTTVGTKGDNQLTDTISQESSKSISKDEWLISIDKYAGDTAEPQIQRIPSLLRDIESNKNCYDPLIVSIGPYHHGKKQLKAFEKLKIPVARKFVHACGIPVSIEQLYKEVEKVGKSARECYKEVSTDYCNDELFNRMMFLDACFVLHFMSVDSGETELKGDPLQPWESYFDFVRRDLFLLENQIPSLVLKVLMEFRFQSDGKKTQLIKNFFVQKMGCREQKNEEWTLKNSSDIPHLLHLVRKLLIGSSPEDKNKKISDTPHLLHRVWKLLIGSSPEDKNKKSVQRHFRSVMELKSAGIHFRPSQTTDITDVKFKSHIIFGTLTLPPLEVGDLTKSFLLNLAAYEMCPHDKERKDIDRSITSYVYLMDSFIDHADDVKELRKKGILVNYLGSDEDLAQLFNEIGNHLVPDPHAYGGVLSKIENHCNSKGQVWMAEWLHNHFSSPWALLAFLGAILVLALTMVQTYFAVFEQ